MSVAEGGLSSSISTTTVLVGESQHSALLLGRRSSSMLLTVGAVGGTVPVLFKGRQQQRPSHICIHRMTISV